MAKQGDIFVSIQQADFDAGSETRAMELSAGEAGALASFIGMVRGAEKNSRSGQDEPLLAMEIEHYPAMTQSAIEQICADAADRWPGICSRVIHRVGRLQVGEQIVLVLVAATHRKQAFAACEFIMDYLKTGAPFWKKAILASGEQWVEAKQGDQQALGKWRT